MVSLYHLVMFTRRTVVPVACAVGLGNDYGMSDGRTPRSLGRRLWTFLLSKPEWAIATADDRATLERSIVGLAAVGAVAAFAFSPLQPFVDRNLLFMGAMLIAMGLIPALVLPQREIPRFALWLTLAPIAAGGAVLFAAGDKAIIASDWNDRRCGRIQKAMLAPSNRMRSDLADVFTAMHCRPLGQAPRDPSYRIRRDQPPTDIEIARHQQFERRELEAEVRVLQPLD